MKQFRILPLGTGNALYNEPGNFHSNFMVEYGEDRLFVDCGSTFQYALAAAGIDFKEVKHLYVSHVHADHAGGLEWLACMNAFALGNSFATTLHLAQEISGDINKILRPAMEASINGAFINGLKACFNLDLLYAREAEYFKIGALKCLPIELLHVDDYAKLYSYALMIEVRGPGEHEKVLITTDAQFQPEKMMPYYECADMILQNCSTSETPYRSHAHFSQLITLPEEIKKKMYLYHYGAGKKPDAVNAGFAGYALPRVPILLDRY